MAYIIIQKYIVHGFLEIRNTCASRAYIKLVAALRTHLYGFYTHIECAASLQAGNAAIQIYQLVVTGVCM